MPPTERTVFISYPRTNAFIALAIFQDLTQHGYDVFLDYLGIASGDFERVIVENIKARSHFLVVLTPSALEKLSDPSDWLRREIEVALATRRNIVPLMFEGFNFGLPTVTQSLTGPLQLLPRYNGLSVIPEYFDAAMEKLRTRHLSVGLDSVRHPLSEEALRAAREQAAAVNAAPLVLEDQLSAEQWFERGHGPSRLEDQIQAYSEAIRLKPDYPEAYKNRGDARMAAGDDSGAIADYTEAIRLRPDYPEAYYERGQLRKDDLAGQIADYTEAIRLTPEDSVYYWFRGGAREAAGDLPGAIADYTEAVRLKPTDSSAFFRRGDARKAAGDLSGAIADYTEVIRLKPTDSSAFFCRGRAREAAGDLSGAIADYTEVIGLKPELPYAYYSRGDAREGAGDLPGATADYTEAIRLNPRFASAYFLGPLRRTRTFTEVFSKYLYQEPKR